VSRKAKRRPHHKAAAPKTTTAPSTTRAVLRPRYSQADELYIEALNILTGRLAYCVERGDIAGWALARCWAEVILAWWREHPR
jgi:hypothetical protein